MPKSVEDIIVPERRRSIRDIPIPEGRRRSNRFSSSSDIIPSQKDPLKTAREVFSNSGSPEKRYKKSRKGLWFGICIAAIVLILASLSLFNSSTLSYVPKAEPVTFNAEAFNAKKTGEGALLFSVVKISKDRGTDVPASGEKTVARKASGKIMVYNNATTEPQRLVATTRFETSSGILFRAVSDFVIPGKKTVGGVTQPGSIEIAVQADKEGVGSNLGLTDFTLPGLAGTSQFSTIYARSKTEMTGGFSGMERVVSASDEANAKAQLEAALRNEINSEALAQVPENFVLIPSLSSITFETLPQTTALTEGNARLNMRANLYGVMFKRSDLSLTMVSNKVGVDAGELVDIKGLEALTFTFLSTTPVDLASVEEINFIVSGQTQVEWLTDEVALKTDLAGRNKREISSILKNYPAIVSATSVIRPFWKSSFPSSSSRITIKKISN